MSWGNGARRSVLGTGAPLLWGRPGGGSVRFVVQVPAERQSAPNDGDSRELLWCHGPGTTRFICIQTGPGRRTAGRISGAHANHDELHSFIVFHRRDMFGKSLQVALSWCTEQHARNLCSQIQPGMLTVPPSAMQLIVEAKHAVMICANLTGHLVLKHTDAAVLNAVANLHNCMFPGQRERQQISRESIEKSLYTLSETQEVHLTGFGARHQLEFGAADGGRVQVRTLKHLRILYIYVPKFVRLNLM